MNTDLKIILGVIMSIILGISSVYGVHILYKDNLKIMYWVLGGLITMLYFIIFMIYLWFDLDKAEKYLLERIEKLEKKHEN